VKRMNVVAGIVLAVGVMLGRNEKPDVECVREFESSVPAK